MRAIDRGARPDRSDRRRRRRERAAAARPRRRRPRWRTWAGEANEICERANELIDELPEPDKADPSEVLGLFDRVLSINRQMVRELTKLPKPEPEREQIQAFLRLGANPNESAEEMVAAFKALNIAAVQERQTEISKFGREFDAAAVALGASTCAESSSFEGGVPQAGG
jgi:hypothetical protein